MLFAATVAINLFIILSSSYYSAKAKASIVGLVVVLCGITLFLHLRHPGSGYYNMASGATIVITALMWAATIGKKGSTTGGEAADVTFECPYCRNAATFSADYRNETKNCPTCKELVQVTDDPAVHAAARKAHDDLIQAMEEQKDVPFDENSETMSSSVDPIFGGSGIIPPPPEADGLEGDLDDEGEEGRA